MLVVRDASFGYGRGRNYKAILSGLSFTVEQGDFLLLSGSNGCGKSTLIKGLLGLCESQGEIDFAINRRMIGYVPQESHIALDTPATASDIVSMAQPNQWHRSDREVMGLLELVGLKEKARMRYGELSGGQKRRVLLARAFMNKPSLLIMDEPTAFADRESVTAIEQIIAEKQQKENLTIIAATHADGWTRETNVIEVEKYNGGV